MLGFSLWGQTPTGAGSDVELFVRFRLETRCSSGTVSTLLYAGAWQISTQTLDNFLTRLEQGYSKFGNPYHNLVHAADVTQTTHHLFSQSGLVVSALCVQSYFMWL